jgi:hypothetical protein
MNAHRGKIKVASHTGQREGGVPDGPGETKQWQIAERKTVGEQGPGDRSQEAA